MENIGVKLDDNEITEDKLCTLVNDAHREGLFQEIEEGMIEGKSWIDSIYSSSSWKEPLKIGVFLEGIPVHVSVSATKVLGRISNPVGHIIYKIQVEHGLWKWSVEKRFQNFISLHTSLIFFKGKEHFHGMVRGLHRILDVSSDTPLPPLPRFPGKPDTMMTSPELLEERRVALELYLNTILECDVYRENPEMISFLEVSRFSFMSGSIKSQEGFVKKRHGDFRSGGCCRWQYCMRCQMACCAQLATQWGRRWLIVFDTSILYVNPETGKIKEVFLYDSDTTVGLGFKEAGTRKGFKLTNSSRTLVIKCFKKRIAERWVRTIKESLKFGPGAQLSDKNIRFESFAPPREGNAKWFVDGCDYLAAVANAIVKAKEEIFITDWWLSPELYLKRGLDREPWRLTTLLRKKAEEGVKISILLYKEVAAVLGINSMHSKRRMLQHPNIRVIRHPDHTPLPIMWAHHEKCVVIDQWTAFVSGIDMCFGRWDTNSHKLVDIGTNTDATDHHLDRTMSGSSLMESIRIINSSRPTITSQAIQSVTMQLLAQHCVLDVAMAPVRCQEEQEDNQEVDQVDNNNEDLAKERKSLKKSARKVMLKVKTVKNIKKNLEDSEEEDDDPDGGLLSRKNPVPQLKLPDSQFTWPGKDYVNWIVRDLNRPDLHDQDNADRMTTPRMPWHDIGLGVTGAAARDVARHFIQRWNHLKSEKLRFNDNYTYLLPKSYDTCYGGTFEDLLDSGTRVTCQVVRSVSDWSVGQDRTEFSIMQALISAISQAKHYVYIENQFFISYVKNGSYCDVRNDIATTIFNRIVAAHENNQTFRVYILMPLLPAFEGDIAGDSGSGMRAIMYYQYQSISRGENSLINRLQQAGIKQWNKYIGFYSLRTHDELKGTPVTELVYIHSKLCIVDDRMVICGSANINDRSLLGIRDSELCLHVEDTEFIDGKMNGEPYQCGKFAGGLRKQLFKEHLGLLDKPNDFSDIIDPVSDDFFENIWNYTANTNTILYDELFSVIPTNSIPTLRASKDLQTRVRPMVETFGRDIKAKLESIRGHLVWFPTQYLEDEDLQPATLAKEGMVPQDLWK